MYTKNAKGVKTLTIIELVTYIPKIAPKAGILNPIIMMKKMTIFICDFVL
jgi:hypothetical protein